MFMLSDDCNLPKRGYSANKGAPKCKRDMYEYNHGGLYSTVALPKHGLAGFLLLFAVECELISLVDDADPGIGGVLDAAHEGLHARSVVRVELCSLLHDAYGVEVGGGQPLRGLHAA